VRKTNVHRSYFTLRRWEKVLSALPSFPVPDFSCIPRQAFRLTGNKKTQMLFSQLYPKSDWGQKGHAIGYHDLNSYSQRAIASLKSLYFALTDISPSTRMDLNRAA